MIVTASRTVALLASTALAATLMGAPSHSSAPSTILQQACPAASIPLPEARGFEAAYNAFTDRDNTCVVIQNTSDAILRVTVESPNRVVFINGYSAPDDPRAVPNEAGAAVAGLRSDTPTRTPVLRKGSAVIILDPQATPRYWISVVDYTEQVKAEFAVRLSTMAYWWLPADARQTAARLNLLHHVEACANAAVLLQAKLAEEGRPTTWDEVFDLLPAAALTKRECMPVHDAAKPPRTTTPAWDTPPAQASRTTLQKLSAAKEEVGRLLRLGRIVSVLR